MENDIICSRAPGATHRLILLHGWGADAEDLMSLGEELIKGGIEQKLELLAFNAPHRHPGGVGRQWYGLFPPDWVSVPSAINDLQVRIKALSKNSIALEKTVILGFSQGGAMALSAGSELPLAGLIGCSSYPHPNWVPSETSPPILLLHGMQDEIVPIEASRQILSSLKKKKLDVDFLEFEGGHEISQETLPRIQLALNNWLV